MLKQRPIKFRVWNSKKSIWEAVSSGLDLVTNSCCHFACLEVIFTSDVDTEIKLSDLVFQQFTGLLDKNGKEIYEGDIVAYHMGTLMYGNRSKSNFGIVVPSKFGNWYIDDVDSSSYRKKIPFDNEFRSEKRDNEFQKEMIVGNIFENPELIK